ncbi:hypothetical protein CQ026_11495 [Brevundimonas sp. MYb31]|nr:hypothetical protein CQ026_11495 [Brevundimonas sp. MYb31]
MAELALARRAGSGRLMKIGAAGNIAMLKSCAIAAAVLVSGLTLFACAAGPAETVRSAAAGPQCRTTPQPGGGSTINCPLWERTTTTTTTTTTQPNGETTTTVEHTRTGGDA